jgi:hypothetical protein
VIRPIRFALRSTLALAIALLLSSWAARAESIAAGGPCAVAPEREPCAGGACSSESSKVRNRFDPSDVGADDAGDTRVAPAPAAPDFSGPGSCADPSAGCGNPHSNPRLASNTPPSPPLSGISGPPAAPIVPNPSGPPIPAAPPGPPAAGVITSPPPPAPPAVPIAANLPPPPAAPRTPPATTPPAPPPPPTVTEPPPAPVLPPGVPQP